ncbi:cytochrome c-type biogenesis protein CcmH/NrfF [Fluviicoccus keumensis]|uniref:Cytochrome c-type biogenesis protein n=1 Tax=Fluviicoccus keumensis TaxID=1435465 RepID=A0A4Q7YKE9_9GAMM|nr:cytochrome c-type biogenesis protein [Fluviicoccus keumensis]RZU37141.1 cytochrome c-type biogenesis protein CcmH/NrfF [Fluviicoccus keumensis]
MSILKWRPLLLLFTLLSALAHAGIDVYDFKSPEEEARYRALINELRCPKCQNQNLAGSDAQIAHDLKNRTFQLIQEGRSDKEIREYMVDRYGDFIMYNPPVRSTTWLLWFGPFALLALVVVVLALVRRKPVPPAQDLTPEEAARLNDLLKKAADHER